MEELKGYVIGFTGRIDGMTDAQKATVYALLMMLMRESEGPFYVLHGDAIGADAEFDAIVKAMPHPITRLCRPCTLDGVVKHDKRAFTEARAIAEPTNPMARNRMIVADSNALISAPPTDFEVKRSGTWATIRYMRKADKPLMIVKADGEWTHEGYKSIEQQKETHGG